MRDVWCVRERAAGSGGVGEGEDGGVGALVAGFGSLFEGAEVLGGGHVDFLAGEEVLDGEKLEAGVFGVGDGFGLEEGGFGGFFAHGGGGGFEGDEDADGGGIAFGDVRGGRGFGRR